MFAINCPTEVQFGAGAAAAIGDHLGAACRVVLVRGGRSADPVAASLGALDIEVVEVSARAEPSVVSINAAFTSVAGFEPEIVVACGGGSVMDTGKALAVCLSQGAALPDDFSDVDTSAPGRVPCIAVPTTAGTGAEVTANAVLGLADGSAKVSLRGRALFPSVALVDQSLMMSAPKAVVLYSGLDAVVQTIEAYTSCKATRFTDALSAPNVAHGLHALRAVIESGEAAAWERLAWVSLSSGHALANGGLGAAHGLASVLGAALAAPHGALCGRLLAPVLRQNLGAAPIGSDVHARLDHCIELIAAVFPARGSGDDLSGFEHWVQIQGLPRLRDFAEDGFDVREMAEAGAAASSSLKNAVPLPVSAYEKIIEAAL